MNACINYVAEVPFSPGAVLRIPTDEDLRLGHVLEAIVTRTFVWGTFLKRQWRKLSFGAHEMCPKRIPLAESPDFDPKQRAPCAPNAISRQRSS